MRDSPDKRACRVVWDEQKTWNGGTIPSWIDLEALAQLVVDEIKDAVQEERKRVKRLRK